MCPLFSPQSPNVHNYPDMEAVPLLLNNVKGEPPEDSLSVDHFQTQTEPVDLSINKARTSPTAVSSSPVSMTALKRGTIAELLNIKYFLTVGLCFNLVTFFFLKIMYATATTNILGNNCRKHLLWKF